MEHFQNQQIVELRNQSAALASLHEAANMQHAILTARRQRERTSTIASTTTRRTVAPELRVPVDTTTEPPPVCSLSTHDCTLCHMQRRSHLWHTLFGRNGEHAHQSEHRRATSTLPAQSLHRNFVSVISVLSPSIIAFLSGAAIGRCCQRFNFCG